MGLKLNPLEFELFRKLKSYKGSKFLVAVSGGKDSVSLLHLLSRIANRLEISLKVAHVHHGKTEPKQFTARNRAAKFVKQLAKKYDLEFFENGSGFGAPKSQSEAALREFRLAVLESLRIDTKSDYVVFAHHADDLLETRLLRLIRGTGAEGIRAMKLRSGKKLRPLLDVTRENLHAYADECGLSSMEDPSNKISGPLRNWLRNNWLEELEAKRPGSKKSLSRSLALVAEALANRPNAPHQLAEKCIHGGQLDRHVFNALSSRDKRAMLAFYLRDLDVNGVSRSHIEEVIKRLDTFQKKLMFKVGPLNWSINAQQIRAEPTANS
jgi:tRNA(Ile)-lysidine synthase